jgi:hypothetical protein
MIKNMEKSLEMEFLLQRLKSACDRDDSDISHLRKEWNNIFVESKSADKRETLILFAKAITNRKHNFLSAYLSLWCSRYLSDRYCRSVLNPSTTSDEEFTCDVDYYDSVWNYWYVNYHLIDAKILNIFFEEWRPISTDVHYTNTDIGYICACINMLYMEMRGTESEFAQLINKLKRYYPDNYYVSASLKSVLCTAYKRLHMCIVKAIRDYM